MYKNLFLNEVDLHFNDKYMYKNNIKNTMYIIIITFTFTQ